MTSPGAKIAWADAQALSSTYDESTVATLIGMLDDPDEDVLAAAADALGHIGPAGSAAWEPLVRLLSQEHPGWLRDTCAYALGRIGVRNSQVVEALVAATQEHGSNVAERAREALEILREQLR